VSFELSETCYDTLSDGRRLVFERRWTQVGADPERVAEYLTKGRVAGKPVTDEELALIVAEIGPRD